MLTGDKLETAENIGYSCKLLEPTEGFKIDRWREDDVRQKLDMLKAQEEEQDKSKKKKIDGKALLVEGKALSRIQAN